MSNNAFPNPMPIKMADSASIDAFARMRVSNPTTIFESKQIFDNAPLFWDDSEVSGGSTTSVHSVATASTVMGVALNTAGVRVRQTFMRFNYFAGKSQLVFLTGTLGNGAGGGTGIKRCMGYYDDDNGMIFQDNEGVLTLIVRSSTSGSVVDDSVVQSNFNLDPLDGTGDSGVTLDPTKSQIGIIDFEWLAVGRVRMGFVFNGIPVYCHEFNHANLEAGAYMSTPNLPLRYEIINDGTGAASTLEHICGTVITEGGSPELGNLCYSSTDGTHVDCATDNTLYAILGLRLKSTHLDEAVKIVNISIAEHAGNNNYQWKLLFNPTVAGTFTYSDEANSAIQVATGATANTVTGGSPVGGGYESSSNKGGAGSAAIDNSRLLGSAIDGTVDELVLCVMPVGGSSNLDIEAGIIRRELT